ncbi:MAG: hypothetical protein M0Z46_16080 [Actinomycetota bacterium]|jgi:hypothetical protein|nr:hypothetical protein [Actinomycetota bacterium]
MTMHGPYGDDYGQDDTTDLFRSLALASARLWEELFQRLGRIERAQSELHELVARIQGALPAAIGSDALGSNALGSGALGSGANDVAGAALPPATSAPYEGASLEGASLEPPALSWLTNPAAASAPLLGTTGVGEGADELSFTWHVPEAEPDGADNPRAALPQILNGVDAGPASEPPPPPPPPGFHADTSSSTDFQLGRQGGQGEQGAWFEEPPPAGFQVDGPLGASAPPPPPPPPPPVAPLGFHVEDPFGGSVPPPPPAGFTAVGAPTDPAPSAGLSPFGSGLDAAPPPPPLGYTIVRPVDAQQATVQPPDAGASAFDAARAFESLRQDHASASVPGAGLAIDQQPGGVTEEEPPPPAITPDFFARAGWRRR